MNRDQDEKEKVQGISGDQSADEEIIELVDVVSKGERPGDPVPGEAADSFESLDFDFETLEDVQGPAKDSSTEVSREDPSHVAADTEREEQDHVPGPGAMAEIPTERLESIVAETVRDVVERVVRETMSEVAEKVIKEAIEGLKQSLEPPPP